MSETVGATATYGAPGSSGPSGEEVTERVRLLLPALRDRGREGDENRRQLDVTIDDIAQTGLFRAYVPPAFGGLALDVGFVMQATRLLATASPATAWTISLLTSHASAVALLSKQAQEDVWTGGPDTLICSSMAPAATATRVDGGVVISGRYSWSSGCEFANWAVVGFLLLDESGTPDAYFGILPRESYEIDDVWQVAGLKATGSQDLVLNEAFIPEHRYESARAMDSWGTRGFGVHPEPLYRLPFQILNGTCFSAVSLGAAEGIVELYRNRLLTRVRAYTGARVRLSPPAYMRLAESTQDLAAIAALLERDWDEMATTARSDELVAFDDFKRWRTDVAYATRVSVRAADRLFEASGASILFDKHAMQRLWRDLHASAGHFYNDYDVASQAYGRALLGLEEDPAVM